MWNDPVPVYNNERVNARKVYLASRKLNQVVYPEKPLMFPVA